MESAPFKTIAAIVGLILVVFACAYSPGSFADNNYRFERILTEDGFSLGETKVIFQDSLGFMWFGGEKGAARFDGYDYVVYQTSEKANEGPVGNYIWDIKEDSQGFLWFSTSSGLSRFNRKSNTFKSYRYSDSEGSISHNVVRLMLIDSQKNLWLGTHEGLNLYQQATDNFLKISMPAVNSSLENAKQITEIYEDSKQNIWVGLFGSGLYKINKEIKRLEAYQDANSNNYPAQNASIFDMTEDSNGRLWLGTGRGLASLNQPDKTQKQLIKKFNSKSSNTRISKLIAKDHLLWVGTNSDGIYLLDLNKITITHFTNDPLEKSSVNSNKIVSIFADRAGDFWTGFYPVGSDFINSRTKNFSIYRNRAGETNTLVDNLVNAFYEDPNGKIWIATEKGLDYYDPKTEQLNRTLLNHLVASPVLSFSKDKNDNVWIGTWSGGIKVLSQTNGDIQLVNVEHDIDSLYIWSLMIDNDENLWVGAQEKGAYKYNLNSKKTIHYKPEQTDINKLSGIYTRDIYQDSAGIVWISTLQGLNRYNKTSDSFTRFENKIGDDSSLANNGVSAIYEDSRGFFWVGTDGGLSLMDRKTGTFKNYNASHGLVDGGVTAIVEDNEGFLWLTSKQGLIKFDIPNESFEVFRKKDGLAGDLFNRASLLHTRTGEIYAGGTNGFTRFKPSNLKSSNYRAPLYITDFKIFDNSEIIGGGILKQDISLTNQITLNYKHSMFSFEFSLLNYNSSSRARYAYQLKGFDERWLESGDKRVATYTNLDPGEYEFKVRATSGDQKWIESKSLKITILPPWWRTHWAYLGYALIVLSLIFWVIYTYRQKLIVIKEKLEIERLKKTQSQLVQSESMSSVNTMVAGMAHEINNPVNFSYASTYNLQCELNSFKDELNLIAGDDSDNEIKDLFDSRFSSFDSTIKTIHDGLDRVKHLVEDLRSFSKTEEAEYKNYCLNSSLQLCIDMAKASYEGFVNFVFDIEDNIEIYCNPAEVNQAFRCLVVNACQAIRSKQIQNNDDQPGKLTLKSRSEANYIVIQFIDDGCGMDEETEKHIFEPFFTTRQVGEGAGLGLSIVYSIVNKHHGTIYVESTPQAGTSISLQFPKENLSQQAN